MPDRLEQFQAYIRDGVSNLPPDIELEFRKMFGGMGAYARGRFFAATFDGGFSLKFGPEERERRLKMIGKDTPMPAPDESSKSYVPVPTAVREDPEQLREWVEASIAYVQTLPVPKRKTKS
jgi:TfoX/Sxy family transcriptional regulator of competence genes